MQSSSPTQELGEQLGPLDEELIVTGRFNYVLLLAIVGGLAVAGLGFVIKSFSFELWMFGGFAAIVGAISWLNLGWLGSGRLALHRDGFQFTQGAVTTTAKWNEVERAAITRIPIKMEGLVKVGYTYEAAIFLQGGKRIDLSRSFLDQLPGQKVAKIVTRLERYEIAS